MAGSTKQAQNKGRRSSPKPASDELVLDQNEIMRAMLAMQKGKQREGSDSDDESERDESEGDASEEEAEGSASEAESSTFAQQNLKRRRSLSLSLGEESEPEAAQPARQTQGRVGVSRTATSTKTPLKTQPKPTGLQSAPKPAAGTSFEDLGLSQPIIRALASISITKPTEIQSACIGPIMAGRDCIGGAKTGSGKTMAFALPILERIARDPFGVWAVVLTPTRELAYQLTEQFLAIGKPLGLTTTTIVGGMDSMKQAKELEGRPHIIVATPGRLCDLLRSGGVGSGKLSRVKMLVLDEADRMLTPTFAPDLAYLFSQVPAKRQTCLFTATVSEAIMDLANKPPPPGKEAPHVYRVASDTLTVANLKQKYLFIPSQIRDPYLLYILQNPLEDIDIALRIDPKKAKAQEREATMGNKRGKKSRSDPEPAEESQSIPSTVIFTQRCATAHLLHLLLNSLDIPSVPLHSHLTQPQRLLSLARFRAHEVPVLVTTDVGSRGLDIPEVAMVINWDCPRRADDYVHRVGRTARAGRGGVAVTIVTERDVELVKVIEDEVNVQLEELKLNEDTVLEGLNKVSMARRLATMEMHDSGFGERQALNKAKQIKRQKRDATK